MASKAALKAIKTAIDGQDFAKASSLANDLLKQDEKNYHALMFLGFAEEKLKHLGAAESALQKALNLKPDDVQPYKGLIRLFEQQGSEKVDAYHYTALGLANIYARDEDREQCQSVMNHYDLFVKKNGSKAQYRRALELMLPSSPIYPVLEGRVPHPSHTYLRLLESVQAEEKQWMDNEIGERRTRLGARLDTVKAEVAREAIDRFHVEYAYQNLIDWTQDDEKRHTLDQELLQRMLDNLLALPAEAKPQQRDRVLEKANGMVIIKQPFVLAWDIALEWVDTEDLAGWDPNILFQYVDFFPESGLAKVMRGWLFGISSPFPLPKVTEGEEAPQRLSETDQLILMMEGLEQCPRSMLAHRLMSATYLTMDEHKNAAEMARISTKLYRQAEIDYAMPLQDSIDAVDIILGRSLVIFQSPRHHPEARRIFEGILARKPRFTEALLGIGLVYEEDEDYSEAVKFLGKAIEEDPANVRIRLEYAWCKAQDKDLAGGLALLQGIYDQLVEEKSEDINMKAETLYRIAYCKWHLNTSSQARKDKSGTYSDLISVLKLNPNYAPAYTLMGLYFLNYGKKTTRAKTAFKAAFEISTSELIAAEHLAQIYAMNAEWDFVELVAQHVVDSGKARPAPGSKKKSYSWPYAALGVVQMSRFQYSLSITSFQDALRISPDNYHCWVGLGESYHNSGRYIAASRAFNKAESIEHGLTKEETWFAQYMLANVQRELGAFDEAIKAYEQVLEIRKDEMGALLSLLQTLVDFGWARIHQGHFGHAAELATKAIGTSINIARDNAGIFNLWKAVGDACAVMNAARSFANPEALIAVHTLLSQNEMDGCYEVIQENDQIELNNISEAKTDTNDLCGQFSEAAILAYKRGVESSSNDIHAQAVSWYNLGWAEHAAYVAKTSTAKGRKPRHLLKAAVRCFKTAIELEASNSEFWNALGVATINLSPKVSQHALIRSLHLNDHSARTWTNLGTLYLIHNENELANQAFTRAQSTDPEYAAPWLGQGLIALLYGKVKDAASLFKHAYEISDSYSIPIKRHFAMAAFDHIIIDTNLASDVSSLIQPLFALRQLQTQSPSDIVTQHFLALFAERVNEHSTATKSLNAVVEAAEAEYETSETDDALCRFAQAKSDLARQCLAEKKFEEAVESAQFALDVSEDDIGPSYIDARARWRLSAQITLGIAYSYLKQMSNSIDSLEAASKTSKLINSGHIDPNITVILAQILWAAGSEKEKQAARTQLFDCIAENPDHVGAATLLAVIAVMDDDSETLEVATDDLKAMRAKSDVTVAEKLSIAKVLAAVLMLKIANGGSRQEASNDAAGSIMLAPEQPQGWLELATVTKDEHVMEMAVKTALKQIPPSGKLTSEDLAKTYAISGKDEDVRQAAMVAPWLEE